MTRLDGERHDRRVPPAVLRGVVKGYESRMRAPILGQHREQAV